MIYLDNAATTVCKFPASAYDDIWGNANTPYKFGLNARQAADDCREKVKKCLGVKGGKVIFCSNASEAAKILCDRLQAYGIVTVCCSYEHDSVYDLVDTEGCQLTYLGDGTAIFQQWVNPVTGMVFDIPFIRQTFGNDCFLCMDATAGIGKIELEQEITDSIDAMWFSGHKFHGPKTGGILWISDRLSKALYLSDDSRNEYGLKHGTLDVPSFIATTCALEYAINTQQDNFERWGELEDRLVDSEVVSIDIDFADNFGKYRSYFSTATGIYYVGCNADALVQYLSSKDIYVGLAHSACSADADYRVTQAFGISKETAERCVRVSFSEDNTLEDIDALVDGIKEFKEKFV
jgi:cysteine desulfurase